MKTPLSLGALALAVAGTTITAKAECVVGVDFLRCLSTAFDVTERPKQLSTKDQDLHGQIEALKAAGVVKIYQEKVSGVRADRPQLAKLMAALRTILSSSPSLTASAVRSENLLTWG